MKEEHAKFTGDIPHYYDVYLGHVLFEHYADDLSKRAMILNPKKVLELACGTGIVTRRLKDALSSDTEIFPTDLNEDMLNVARQKFKTEEVLSFEAANALELPYGDGSFDLVACQFGVMFFPDKELSYREVNRVLQEDGTYLFSVWSGPEDCPMARVAADVTTHLFPTDPPNFYEVPFSYCDVDDITNSLKASGFNSVRHHPVEHTSTVSNMEGFAKALVHGNPMIQEIHDRGTVSAQQAEKAIFSAIVEEFGSSPGRIPMKAIVFEAS